MLWRSERGNGTLTHIIKIMNETIIIFIMELIGTIAFAISGALIAVRRGLDLFGVVFVGCITSVGGGILRDLILGKIPPTYSRMLLF